MTVTTHNLQTGKGTMKDKTTSAETQLTGPERIWIRPRFRMDPICAGGIYHDEQPPDESIEFVRADLAINESPKTEVEGFSICYDFESDRFYLMDQPKDYEGGEVVRKEDYDALANCGRSDRKHDPLLCNNCATCLLKRWNKSEQERDSLARVNESLVAALMKFGGHLHTCDIHNPPTRTKINKCDCGYRAALAAKDSK